MAITVYDGMPEAAIRKLPSATLSKAIDAYCNATRYLSSLGLTTLSALESEQTRRAA